MTGYVIWPIMFGGFGLLFTAIELLRPARPLSYRAALKNDLPALAIYGLIFLPVSMYLSRAFVRPELFVVRGLLDLPLVVRLVLYYVLADLGLYGVHRLMHSRYFWRVHRWHHSPPYMYWLAGIVVIFAEGFFQNDWMHMNVTWCSRWLEWVFVTPRYHHVHHSRNPLHHTTNLGSRLTIWDRLFGSYVNPETIDEISFGIDDQTSAARLALGV
jgi:sterol desaturase/sphingolipid hydroxylase (fatty acid hydroxylase superfamily)